MKINFPEPTPKINYLSKQNLTAPPPSQNQMVVSLHCVPKTQSITDKLSIAHCALRVAPFTTSHGSYWFWARWTTLRNVYGVGSPNRGVQLLFQSACTSVPSHIRLKYRFMWRKTPINSKTQLKLKLNQWALTFLSRIIAPYPLFNFEEFINIKWYYNTYKEWTHLTDSLGFCHPWHWVIFSATLQERRGCEFLKRNQLSVPNGVTLPVYAIL